MSIGIIYLHKKEKKEYDKRGLKGKKADGYGTEQRVQETKEKKHNIKEKHINMRAMILKLNSNSEGGL